uniref:Uncharacterized protein n=1 Tax=Strigamia maritima TaxID=126957 RepID=T1JDC4_STRMM
MMYLTHSAYICSDCLNHEIRILVLDRQCASFQLCTSSTNWKNQVLLKQAHSA